MFLKIKKLTKTYFVIALSYFSTFCGSTVKGKAKPHLFITNPTQFVFLRGKAEEFRKKAITTTKLNSGVEIPIIGYGTWRIPSNHVGRLIREAIDVGYRHIDCADRYGNQSEVGVAIENKIKEGVLERKELFITGKLWNTKHDPNLVRGACENALKQLRITYFDNYLIHFPTGFVDSDEMYPKDKDGKTMFSDVDYVDTWCAMEALVDLGLCRSIGLSNFNIEQIKRVLNVARIRPANLQAECHPYLNQCKLIEFCRENNIVMTAYSPLGQPHSLYAKPGAHKLLEHPLIVKVSEKHKKSPALILLRYQIQRGNVVITMSKQREHMADNLNICSFALSEEEMMEIEKLNFNGRINIMQDVKGHPHHPFESDQN